MKNSQALKTLGTQIKRERKARGLTQTELGELSGTSINFISQIEGGKATAQIGRVLEVLRVLGLELRLERGRRVLVAELKASP